MIRKIIIQDFFSFKGKTEIALNSGVNILLGINGSGKTSFLNAFKLLYEGICGTGFEKLFQNQWGGFHEVVNVNQGKAPDIQLTYVFDHEVLKRVYPSSPFETDVHYNISVSPSGTGYTIRESLTDRQFTYLDFKNGKGKLFEADYTGDDISGQELVLRQINDPMRYLPSHTIRKAIEMVSIYGYFDTSPAGTLRKPASEFSTCTKLRKNGDNLVHLLNHIKNNRTVVYDEIGKNLTAINPAYKSIEFSYFGSQLYLSLREKNLDKTVGALHLSDGTLRYLLMLAILCNPDRGFLIGIDEPEYGLHPDMIESIYEMMKSANDTQMLVATHSPLFLNHFDLEDILIFEKNEKNETSVKRISEDDFPDWEGEFLAGQMWLNGQIGGKRW